MIRQNDKIDSRKSGTHGTSDEGPTASWERAGEM